MSIVLKPFSENADGGPLGYSFWCPGCEEAHCVWVRRPTSGPQVDVWDWNGDVEKPTFTPSVKVTSGHFMPNHQGACWCTWKAKHPSEDAPFECSCCHSFIAEGVIDFLDDCTHALRGKHPLPPHPRVTQS